MLYRAVGSSPTVFLSCLLRQPWTKASTLAKVALGTRPYSLLLYLPSWKFPLSTKQIIIIINHQSSIIILVVLIGEGRQGLLHRRSNGAQRRPGAIQKDLWQLLCHWVVFFYYFLPPLGFCYRKSLVLKRKRNDKIAHPCLGAIPERQMDGRRYGRREVGVLHDFDASRLMPFQSYLLYYITLLYTRRHHDHHRYHGGLARNWRDTCWEGWHGWIET